MAPAPYTIDNADHRDWILKGLQAALGSFCSDLGLIDDHLTRVAYLQTAQEIVQLMKRIADAPILAEAPKTTSPPRAWAGSADDEVKHRANPARQGVPPT